MFRTSYGWCTGDCAVTRSTKASCSTDSLEPSMVQGLSRIVAMPPSASRRSDKMFLSLRPAGLDWMRRPAADSGSCDDAPGSRTTSIINRITLICLSVHFCAVQPLQPLSLFRLPLPTLVGRSLPSSRYHSFLLSAQSTPLFYFSLCGWNSVWV